MSFVYGPLSQTDREIPPNGFSDEVADERHKRHDWNFVLRNYPVHWRCYASCIVLLIISSTMLLASIFVHQSRTEKCVEKHSVFSPLLDILNDDYQVLKFNGTFREFSPYKGPPSSSVDAAWENLFDMGAFRISPEILSRINGSTDSAQFPPESGGGYIGFIEVLHQLHCVNLLWQHIYKDYYETRSGAYKDSKEVLYEHLNHCADLLRQKIMCDVDVGLITMRWVKKHDHPYPDFNTLHKCRDFDAVWRWLREHQVKVSGGWVEKPEDAVELNLPP